jgi:predicted nucleic acid-binding Zn ribbon protein
MRKSKTESLRDVLKNFVQENHLERKLNEVELIHSWESVMGKTIMRYTKKLNIHNKVLFVETTSPMVRNELIMMREEIRQRLNEVVGEEIITAIIFK